MTFLLSLAISTNTVRLLIAGRGGGVQYRVVLLMRSSSEKLSSAKQITESSGKKELLFQEPRKNIMQKIFVFVQSTFFLDTKIRLDNFLACVPNYHVE